MSITSEFVKIWTILCCIYWIANDLNAQKTEERRLSSFDEVEITAPVELILIQGPREKVVIESNTIDPKIIRTTVRREGLTISAVNSSTYMDQIGSELPKVHLHYIKMLRMIIPTGCILNTQNTMKGFGLSMKVGNITIKRFDIELSKFAIQVEDHGAFEGVSGKVATLNLEVNMLAKFDGIDLLASFALVDVIDKGIATINVKHRLNATVKTFATLNYVGNPSEIVHNLKSGGQLNKIQ